MRSSKRYLRLTAAQVRLRRKRDGAGRDRTDDLHAASVALSQLSYGPNTDDSSERPRGRRTEPLVSGCLEFAARGAGFVIDDLDLERTGLG